MYNLGVISVPTKSVADEAVYKELDDSLERAATTTSSLEAEQDSGNIRVNTPQSDEDSPKLKELMKLCTNLQNIVLDLENTKTTQALEIDSLKRRVKKLEKKQRLKTHKLKRLYKVGLTARVESSDDNEDLGEDASKQKRISVIDADEGITLVSTHDDKQITAATTPTMSIDEVTLVQALAELKQTKPKAKAKGIVFHEPEGSTTTTIPKPKSQDNGKAITIEEPVKLKKKDQIMLDEEVALKLQAKFDKEQRLTREKAQKEEEANIELIET
uniref:Uncharacterized protein n=1 Tax=Tanacetum cinerariifolium TaxID=118510 RepID=A0A6L2MPU5_TANCI|nr:hypothetical protein [Tanacetum cinerariifolium]